MDNKDAAALIIENIATLDEANRLLNGEVTENIFRAINQTVKAWAEGKNWAGSFDFMKDDDLHFEPEEWQYRNQKTSKFIAKYSFDCLQDEYDEVWVTALLAAGNTRVCFRFEIVGNQLRDINKKSWKAFANQMYQENPEIGKAGFQPETDGTWVLPWKIDAKSLAENYITDTIADALGPVKEALERIDAVHPTFVKIIAAAQQKYGVKQDE